MARRQYFNIKYPFTDNGFQNFFIDVNMSTKEKIRSQIMHVIFTPKGQRIRMPEFGTNLIQYIFTPNEEDSWESIKNEIIESVERWVSGAEIRDIRVIQSNDDGHEIYVRIDYSIKEGNKTINDSVVAQL